MFAKPSYQDTLPAGSTPITSGRGVPDVAYQASSRTGVLVYDTAPGDATGGLLCPPDNPCSAGWYVVGGTSASSPQFGGIVAIADQIAGHGLGQINPTLYKLASGPNYGTYFYDVTTGNNGAVPVAGRAGLARLRARRHRRHRRAPAQADQARTSAGRPHSLP